MARKFYIFPHTDNINMVAVEDCATPTMYITNNTSEPPVVKFPVPAAFPKQINDCFKANEMPTVQF